MSHGHSDIFQVEGSLSFCFKKVPLAAEWRTDRRGARVEVDRGGGRGSCRSPGEGGWGFSQADGGGDGEKWTGWRVIREIELKGRGSRLTTWGQGGRSVRGSPWSLTELMGYLFTRVTWFLGEGLAMFVLWAWHVAWCWSNVF